MAVIDEHQNKHLLEKEAELLLTLAQIARVCNLNCVTTR